MASLYKKNNLLILFNLSTVANSFIILPMLDRKEKLDFKETKKFVTGNQILIDLSIDIYFIQLEKVIEENVTNSIP